MLTRIEIDGFKSFENFSLDLVPMTAIVGPNASGKSNLFDTIRFLSLLAQTDIRSAMQQLRGEPDELFRQTSAGSSKIMTFAVEVLLDKTGVDAFGKGYAITAQRLRYELKLEIVLNDGKAPTGVFVRQERCGPLKQADEQAEYLKKAKLAYNSAVADFIRVSKDGDAIEIRQDGRQKHGLPVKLSLKEASKTALSTAVTAEFPHLYALREILTGIRFLEIEPHAARSTNDRFAGSILKQDASNLAAVLAYLKYATRTDTTPDGVLAAIASDLASMIPSVSQLIVRDDPNDRQFAFGLKFTDGQTFSSRVISDGTLRLLALLTVLNDPRRSGTLCFEEPENGVHEGRVPNLVEFLRQAAHVSTGPDDPSFQVLLNTHSPKVMKALHDDEIVVADTIVSIDPAGPTRSVRSRMRTGVKSMGDLFDPNRHLTRFQVDQTLQRLGDGA